MGVIDRLLFASSGGICLSLWEYTIFQMTFHQLEMVPNNVAGVRPSRMNELGRMHISTGERDTNRESLPQCRGMR